MRWMLAAVALSLAVPSLAQDVPPVEPPPTPAPRPVAVPEAEVEYQIGPGDILKVTAYGHDDLNQTVVVQPDGTFLFPLIGRVKASDMTTKELERKLTMLLGAYVRQPQITVLVHEFHSRVVYVLGEATRPGTYALVDARTVLDMATKAGISNSSRIVVVRPPAGTTGPASLPVEGEEVVADPEAPRPEILRVSLRDIQAGDLSKNIPLRPNDTVFVIAEKVYVQGEVRNPGSFAPPVDATVREVILLAGGFSEDAGGVRVIRDEEGKKKERKIKLEEKVLPGDIIVVKRKLF